ncbi:hypothetical protein [Sodalis sp. (in: enterobacteria)]|uniref:hypothetical protein n=1 Tax=Sodalis sp. (in: enterobacteria) TaxID=1898979 RepID=UPI003F3DE512
MPKLLSNKLGVIQLSVLTQELTDAEKSAPQDRLAKASVLMNKQYLDDIPDGDSTVKGQSDYGIDKIYDEDTWIDIEALRHEIIDYLDEEKYYLFPINNGEVISDVSLRKILNAHDQVLIKMYDGGWTPKIFLPAMNGGNKTIKIVTNAGYQTRVYYDKQEVVLNRGDALKVTTRVKWHRV